MFFLASPSARDRRSDPFLLRPVSQNYSALFTRAHPFSRSCHTHRNHSLTITRTSFLGLSACHVPTSVSATMAGLSGLRLRRVGDASRDGPDGSGAARL